jgi:cytosine/adenosine deaminase-related metal-dependent hydrolase
VAPQKLWEMATIHGARALGVEEVVGSLKAGKAADFVVFPAEAPDPLTNILENQIQAKQLWIGGAAV